MGLLNILKKKKSTPATVSFQSSVSHNSYYTPFDKTQENSTADYANAIFLNMLSFKAQPIKKTPDEYPRYVSYELNIFDPIKKHEELVKTGYLREATPLEILDTFKVSDLKSILERCGVKAKGKKAELLEMTAAIAPTTLKLPMMYCVSEKGLDFMKQNEDFIKLHLNPFQISFDEFINARESSNPDIGFNDVIWKIFNERELSFGVCDYQSKRNNALHRAMFLKSENKSADSLYNYIVVLFYDVNSDIFDEIPSAIKKEIFELKDFYTDEMIQRCYERIDIKNKISKGNFKVILDNIFGGEV